MIAHLLMLVSLSMAQSAVPTEPTVVFVCEHGAAKSVIATTYFNKIAAELALARGLRFALDVEVGAAKVAANLGRE